MTTLLRAAFLSVAAALLLALAAPTALAQGLPQPGVTITLNEPSVELGASNSTQITGSVQYTDSAPALNGATDGTVTLSVTAPEGWTVVIEPASAFSLGPGANADFTVTITAPSLEAGAANADGDATVTASAQSPDGRSATGTASLGLTAIAPPAILPPPWYQTPGGIAAIVGAILLVLAIAAFAAHRSRQKRLAAEAAARDAAERAAWLDRETGVTLALAGGPLQYGHRREVVYRLALVNQSQRPRVALIDIAEVTNGWRAATQVTKIPLSVGETQTVTLVVTPDAVITPGDKATVTVRARPEEAREKDERITIDVIAPKSGVPQDPHYKIVSVHREGVGIKSR